MMITYTRDSLSSAQGEVSVVKELLKLCVGRSEYTLPALLLGAFEKLSLSAEHPTALKMKGMCDELRRELQVVTL